MVLWLVLYARADPSSHWGAFYGNSIADWFGSPHAPFVVAAVIYAVLDRRSSPDELYLPASTVAAAG